MLINCFLQELFQLPAEWKDIDEENYEFSGNVCRENESLEVNSTVITPFGVGTILTEKNHKGQYLIQLHEYSKSVLIQDYDVEKKIIDSNELKISNQGSLYYSSVNVFFFLRLYGILFHRLSASKFVLGDGRFFGNNDTIKHVLERKSSPTMPTLRFRSVTDILREDCRKTNKEVNHKYGRLLRGIVELTEGTLDCHDFEEECRALMGTHSYFLFTIDKVLNGIVKQMNHICSKDTFCECNENVTKIRKYLKDSSTENLANIHKENFKCLISGPAAEFCIKFSYNLGKLKEIQVANSPLSTNRTFKNQRNNVYDTFPFLDIEIVHGYNVPTRAAMNVSAFFHF